MGRFVKTNGIECIVLVGIRLKVSSRQGLGQFVF